MNMPKMPNGSATPLLLIQSETKKVQAKAMMERRMATMTKQSPARYVYASISYEQSVSVYSGIFARQEKGGGGGKRTHVVESNGWGLH